MVKVIIQTENKTDVLEGEFFFGAVVTDQGDRYAVTECLVGKMAITELPRIIAKTAVNIVKRVGKGNENEWMVALTQLRDGISEMVKEELLKELTLGNTDAIRTAMKRVMDESGKE